MKKILYKLLYILLVTILFAGVIGCEKKASSKITILYPNWSEGIAMSYLAKVALEDQNYQVEMTLLDPGPIYAALAMNKGDVFLDAWLPYTHGDYWKKYGEKLEVLGTAFADGTTGLVVPRYLDRIDSITQLPQYKKLFDGKIIGIGSGAGIHKNTEIAIQKYGLEYEQVTSSDAAMMASLQKAYLGKEPIVITGWKPHFKWAKFDLKYLEDPQGVFPKDECRIVARRNFAQDFPQAARFFSRYRLTEAQLYHLMDAVQNADDATAAARKWYQEHRDLVQGWFAEE